jgi:cell wall-associated NlpC family hydrolase
MVTSLDSPLSPSLQPQRSDAVAIARTWLKTPYVLGGRIKGAGCDCATFLAEYLIECGFAERDSLGVYSHDWFCHTRDERYMLRLIRHAPRTLSATCIGTIAAEPGSLALFKVAGSRVFNHGGIITKWPMILHATQDGVKESDATKYFLTSHRELAIFDPWGAKC